MPVFFKGFQHILYHKFIYQNLHDVSRVARRLGISAASGAGAVAGANGASAAATSAGVW